MPRFVQDAPPATDPYRSDHVLRSYLDRYLGPDRAAHADHRLAALGTDITTNLRAAHDDAETHPPVLHRYDAWGTRVDRVETAPGWQIQRAAAARHAVVALPYLPDARTTYGSTARVVQHALLHLYGPESATFSCPVAMSDGAAALLSRPDTDAAVRDTWRPRLLSTDPDTAITSGQWMTETQGGSDISRTTTTATHDGTTWHLTGEKWFCSAADSAVAVALARPAGAASGSRALAPFLVPRYDGTAPAPGIRLHRLKDKLGTRAVPTAEIGLDHATAYPIGDPDTGGLARMLTLVVVTRLHNAAAAAAGMRRGLDHARAYATTRTVATGRLDANPLHRATLSRLAVDAEAAFALTMHAFALLGAVEVGTSDIGTSGIGTSGTAADELRLIAPIAKIATARWAVANASEYLECFGGAGFVEDTGIPRLLRDAQVLPIWEGTTNVLATDVLRAITRDEGAKHLLSRIDASIGTAHAAGITTTDTLAAARTRLGDTLARAADATTAQAQAGARDLALACADTVTAALLVDQAAVESARGDRHGAAVADLWITSRLGRADIGVPAAEAFDLLLDRR